MASLAIDAFERAARAADITAVAGGEPPIAGMGVSARLDWREWMFVNPDLTIHLHRAPQGECVGLQAITEQQPYGVGLVVSVLHDASGVLRRGLQSLYLDVKGG